MPRQVLITGVSSGIGLGLARECARRGDRVFALGRRPPPVPLPGLTFEPCDLTRFESIPACLDRLLAGIPRLDLAILNAGVLGRIADLSECSLDELKAVVDVNLWANKVLIDVLLSGARGVAQVVAISSGAAVSGARGWNAYALSKAGLNMLIRLYAAERPEVHFSALAPGLVDTAMQERMRALPEDPRFSTVERLKQAAGTSDMPDPDSAAPRLLDAMTSLSHRKSGDFHDIRSLD